MIIRTSKKDHPFALIDKTGLEDYNLTWDAKGILCYVLSKPDDWKVHIKELAQNSADGITVVRTAINELIQAGYITKKRIFNSKTKCIEGFEYIFYESPQIKKEVNQKKITKTKKVTKKQTKNNQQKNDIIPHLEKLNMEQPTEIKPQLTNTDKIWEQYIEFRNATKPISIISIKKISQKLFEKGGEDFEIWAIEKAIEKEYFSFKIDTLWSIYLREKNNTQKTTKKNKNFNLERDYEQHSDNNKSTGISADDRSTSQEQSKPTINQGRTDWEDDEI